VLTELIAAMTGPGQAAQWLDEAAVATSHLMQERGLNVAVERLSALMTDGDPLTQHER
jgi:hypothetical protein